MNYFKIITSTLLLTSVALQAQIEEPSIKKLPPSMKHSKVFYFASMSLFPGAGASIRNREGMAGSAIDFKLGVLPFVFDTVIFIPIISGDWNYIHFFKAKEISPYISGGVGAAYGIPYIPLRAGMEYKNGFVDIGGKLVYGYLPLPEARCGLTFEF